MPSKRAVHSRVLGTGNEERAGPMRLAQSLVVQITPIHHVERTRLDRQDGKYIDIANLFKSRTRMKPSKSLSLLAFQTFGSK